MTKAKITKEKLEELKKFKENIETQIQYATTIAEAFRKVDLETHYTALALKEAMGRHLHVAKTALEMVEND